MPLQSEEPDFPLCVNDSRNSEALHGSSWAHMPQPELTTFTVIAVCVFMKMDIEEVSTKIKFSTTKLV